MDVIKYPTQKQKGGVTIAKYGKSFKIVARAYDPDTGEETLPVEGVVTREQMAEEKRLTQERLAALDMLLADMDALANK